MLSRRELIKLGVLSGSGVLLGEKATELFSQVQAAEAKSTGFYPLNDPENQIYSVCLQCNTGCPIKVKVYEGVAAKIDGSPYAPWTLYPHLPLSTPLEEAAKVDGALCPKGQAGLQTVYDPYRIRKVLKRAGPRGSGKWKEIPFEQAVREIAEGGKLFADIGDDRDYPGLKEVWALRDPKVMKAMKARVEAIWREKDPAKKRALVESFKEEFKEHLHTLIDPDHPDLGPKNNQAVFAYGRLKAGRSDFFKWFFQQSLGSVNVHGHTTVCQGSLYFTGKAMSYQLAYDEKKGQYTWTGGEKFYWQADLTGAEFVIFVGANIFEANYGPPLRVNKLTLGAATGNLKYVVIDPRAQKGVAHATKWLPVKPGQDAAIAFGMMRWMFEKGRFDARFLSAANKAAAQALGEPSWTNATWLVELDEEGFPAKLLRMSHLGMDPEVRVIEGQEVVFDHPVVLVKGKPTPVDPQSEDKPVYGDLFVDTTLNGIRVKSVLQLIREEALSRTLEEWAELAGVEAQDIAELAYEFTRHGKKAVVDVHRGASQHSNGFYNCFAWFTLNAMVGNYDHHGGFIKASTYDITGKKAGGPFNMDKLHPAKMEPFGISLIRHDVNYEDTTLFEGYPAKRPWFPHSSDVYQEILPSAAQGYPYPVKILFHYMGSPAYALPAGHTQIQAMLNPDKIPLIVAFDIVVGDTYLFADYIIPDLSYLERWEFHGSHPNNPWKVQTVRQPTIPPIPETVKVFGQEMPISAESFFLALAEYLGLPGFGEQGFANGMPFTHPDHFYLKLAANLAFGEKADGSDALPEADDKELEIFRKARRHLPPSVFDENRWREAVGDESLFRRTVYLLNRGGRYQAFEKAFKSDGTVANAYGRQINLYLEKHAKTKNSMTGKPYWPLPRLFHPYTDALGQPIPDEAQGYELTLLTHRVITMTKSRTISNYWLLNVMPENYIAINPVDAKRLGFKDGELVKVVSASNPEGLWDFGPFGKKPMVGKLKVLPGIRPGNVAFALGYGHWAYGASDIEINGQVVKADPRRAAGIHANAAMRVDPVLKDVGLTDLTGGSVVFYDTKVRLVRATPEEAKTYREGVRRMALGGPSGVEAEAILEKALKAARGELDPEALRREVAAQLGLKGQV
ncbi:molybdopterin oxidoreductase [Thermus thermophilus]|uniref:molybdopterin-dependent oxidoreductase n=1 Tax=Thermus thermophilus TaxID=274 RepID=UPI00090B6FB4|nr:molybdopterin-dependent oxidoreductase [Thermus thermophilus]BAW02496.1 molybdopterin oxidoreductase [Thermus thermophilus]BDB10732.1 molybdopterin oxidoreductase [Thermus thermophilus]